MCCPGGVTRFTSYPHRFTKSIAKPEWAVVKTETDAFQDQYYPAVHLNGAGAGALFHDKDRKHLPFLTNHNNGCQPFTVTTTASSESSSKHSNGNCALSLLSDNPTPAQAQTATIPTAQPLVATASQYGRLPGGDVSLTGMSYMRVGDRRQASNLTTSSPGPATAAATQQHLQYHHGYYYHVSGGEQGNNSPDGAAIQALPFSSW